MTTATANGKAKKNKKKELVYPEPKAELYFGDEALTVQAAKDLLGWIEEPEGEDWGEDYSKEVFKLIGIKVRMTNNISNRIIVMSALKKYVQDILECCWKFNMDSIVIGKFGQIMSGQHRLIAFIIAEYMRLKHPEHWSKKHPKELTLECLIGCGVEETDDVFRTLNTGATATVADTLFRSQMLASVPMEDRKAVAKTLERSTNILWDRMGYRADLWAPEKTTSESYMLIEDHPSLLECAIHINKLSKEKTFDNRRIPAGSATALMYLMATSGSDGEEYHVARYKGKASEKLLNLERYQTAEEFFKGIFLSESEYEGVWAQLAQYVTENVSTEILIATLCNSWNIMLTGDPLSDVSVSIGQIENSDPPQFYLTERYLVGGVDKGVLQQPQAPESGGEAGGDDQVQNDPETPKKGGKAKKWKRTTAWLEKLHEANAGFLLVFKEPECCLMLGEDAMEAAPILVLDLEDTPDKIKQISFPLDELSLQAGNLVRVGKQVRVVEEDHETVSDFVIEKKAKATKPKGKKQQGAAAKAEESAAAAV